MIADLIPNFIGNVMGPKQSVKTCIPLTNQKFKANFQ